MKAALFLLALITQSVMAMPIICESHEKSGEISTLRVKINDKIPVRMNGGIWDLHLLGISPIGPGEMRVRMYASPSPRPESIKMTIVKDGAVYGYVDADSPSKNGIYDGKIRIGGILKSRVMNVECIDEAIHGELNE
jgi:hypothetical protein